jgi:Fic family protein
MLIYHHYEGKLGVIMSEAKTNIHVLDAAYKPFPTFAEWASRTSVDTVRWDRYNASLRDRSGLTPEVLNRAREIAKRFAALDTGAIEGLYEVDRGFTYTVAFETAAWEVELAKKGENVRPLFEAQLHAYDYVLSLATKAEPISEAAIRVLHEEVCRAQATYRVQTSIGFQEQPLPKGKYKVLPNHVLHSRNGTDHSHAPVDVTPVEMFRLVEELRSEAFLAAHPVLQAAYAHYGLVVIHPFADGNGRVARALASVFTYRAISMPIVILSEHKEAYLDSLEAADGSDYQSFVDFMLARSLDTIQLVEESLRRPLAPSPEEAVAAIDRLFTTKGGYGQQEVDASGARLQQLMMDEFTKVFSRNTSSSLRYQASFVEGGRGPSNEAYRLPFSGARRLEVRLDAIQPPNVVSLRTYHLFLPKDAGVDDEIQLERADGKDSFVARVSDIIPAISGMLQIRITLFAERVAGAMLAEFKTNVEKILGGQR